MHSQQQAAIIRGLSGSGKSTVAALLADELNFRIVEADHYFIVDGTCRPREVPTTSTLSPVMSAWAAARGTLSNVGFCLQNGTMKCLTWAKALGKEKDAWTIARLVGSALNSILLSEEIPEIVDMAGQLPRSLGWQRTTNLTEETTIGASGHQLTVATACGLILNHRDWSELGDNAKFAVEAHRLDWKTVLSNLQARFNESEEKREVFPDLPGYVFTDRGVPECIGVYVLPPGGQPNDDRDWLGFFPTIETVIFNCRQ